MAPRSRIYWREQGGTRRAYADFRDFADVGGRREALKQPGAPFATDDEPTAQALLTARLEELKRLRRGRALIGEAPKGATLAELARQHLILKKESAKQTDRWIACAQVHLERACAFFGASRPLMGIAVEDVQRWVAHLELTKGGRGGTLSAGTVRHHLNTLSNLYRRARSLGLVQAGYNPVADMMEKPAGRREEARWLEIGEAAWLLDVGTRTKARRPSLACPFLPQLLAAFLLTGGRKSEVLGLEVDDVSFDRQTVTFRPNRWRRLKTAKSSRTVPLWPMLAAVLRPHIFPLDRTPREGLLFPGESRTGSVTMVTNFDKALDHIATVAGWQEGEIRSRIFRNTYAAARLQTIDRGAPVSPYTVSRELGHGSLAMVERIYGHLGLQRHRARVVEFPAALAKAAGKQLEKRRSDKRVVTVTPVGYRKSLLRP